MTSPYHHNLMPKLGLPAFLFAAALGLDAPAAGRDPADAVADWYAGVSPAAAVDSGIPATQVDIGAWHAKPPRARPALPKPVPTGNELAPWYGRAPYRNPSRQAEPPDLSEWFGRKPPLAKNRGATPAEGVTPKDLAAWKGRGWPDIPFPSSPGKVRSPVADDPDIAFWLGRSAKAPRPITPERAPDLSGWFGPSSAGETPAARENPAHASPAEEHRATKAETHAPGADAGGREAHATQGHGDAGTGHESGARPALTPRPDSAFARALDWEQGYAEILEYEVQRPGPGDNPPPRGRLTTERVFLKPDGTVGRGAPGPKDLDALSATLALAGQEEGEPFSEETVVKLPRGEAFRLLRQDQSLQGPPGNAHRSLDCQAVPPRLRTVSSGAEPSRDTVLDRWPLYTEEMLFTYLRAVPQRVGYREEAWLQDWGPVGRPIGKPRYAAITVRRKMRVRDLETYHVTVERDDGRKSEFWIGAQGLHPVAVAILSDGSQWTLRKISRRKAQAW